MIAAKDLRYFQQSEKSPGAQPITANNLFTFASNHREIMTEISGRINSPDAYQAIDCITYTLFFYQKLFSIALKKLDT